MSIPVLHYNFENYTAGSNIIFNKGLLGTELSSASICYILILLCCFHFFFLSRRLSESLIYYWLEYPFSLLMTDFLVSASPSLMLVSSIFIIGTTFIYLTEPKYFLSK